MLFAHSLCWRIVPLYVRQRAFSVSTEERRGKDKRRPLFFFLLQLTVVAPLVSLMARRRGDRGRKASGVVVAVRCSSNCPPQEQLSAQVAFFVLAKGKK